MISKLALLTIPYARLELPGWGRLLKQFGVYEDDLWKKAPKKTIRGKWHGYLMTLNLANWSERQTFFLGRFYDLETQLLIRAAVKPGDNFIDIGANIGMITLLAAHCVESTGTVYAFEPNPRAFEQLKANITTNQLQHVKLYQCGLAAHKGELTLSVITEHTGMGTFAQVPKDDQSFITQQYQLPVERGDDILPNELSTNCFIKIDVEGFEPYVLQGLEQTIRRLRPVILTEVIQQHLERAGSSIKELFTLMQKHGYEAFNIETKRVGLRYRLHLERVKNDFRTNNIAWLHPENSLSLRLKPLAN